MTLGPPSSSSKVYFRAQICHCPTAGCSIGKEVVHDRTLVALGGGGEDATLPLLQLVEDGWDAADAVPLSFVGSMCALVAALASPSTFAVVGDDVPISQSRPEGGEGSYCGVPPCRGRFAPSLLLIYM